jgi:hypothetical protein
MSHMPDSMNTGTTFDVRDMQVIDWYDGVTQAVGRVGDDRSWQHIFLLAWDRERGRKAFAVCPIPEGAAHAARNVISRNTPLSDDEWEELQSTLRTTSVRDRARLVVCVDINDSAYYVSSFELESVGVPVNVGDAISRARITRWIEPHVHTSP